MNAQRERCFLATRVNFANSEEESGCTEEFCEDENRWRRRSTKRARVMYMPKNNYEVVMLKLDKKTKRVRIGRFPWSGTREFASDDFRLHLTISVKRSAFADIAEARSERFVQSVCHYSTRLEKRNGNFLLSLTKLLEWCCNDAVVNVMKTNVRHTPF